MLLGRAVPIVVCVLLVSNLWLLRETDRLRRQLGAWQGKVVALDRQLFRLLYAVEQLAFREAERLDDRADPYGPRGDIRGIASRGQL